jgi:hypothetical protein
MKSSGKSPANSIDIEAVMQDIRRQVLDRKLPSQVNVPLTGKRLPPEFYEHLYDASLVQSQLGVKMYVTKSNIPLLGGLIDRVRAMFHQLVIFYINQIAEQQAEINGHMLQALSALSQYIEEEES